MKKRKRRKVLSLSKALVRVSEIIDKIDDNIQIAMAIRGNLETANNIVRKLRRRREAKPFYGAGAYNIIKQSLGIELTLIASKLFDEGTASRHPNDRDVASIPLLIRLLKQRRCQKVLAKKARGWVKSFEDENEQACLLAISRVTERYRRFRKSKRNRNSQHRLRRFRNTIIAHSLIVDAVKVGPTYTEVFALIDLAMEIGRHAKLAIQGKNIRYTEFEAEYSREAAAFWNPTLKSAMTS